MFIGRQNIVSGYQPPGFRHQHMVFGHQHMVCGHQHKASGDQNHVYHIKLMLWDIIISLSGIKITDGHRNVGRPKLRWDDHLRNLAKKLHFNHWTEIDVATAKNQTDTLVKSVAS